MAVGSGFLARGYFDDTQTSGKVWGIGGYVGGHLHWDHFDGMWPMVLATHEVPYFHMREMADPNGPFAKWHPPEKHEPERAAFFLDLIKAISESQLTGYSCLVRLEDLKRFNAEKTLELEPYPLAAYGCMILVGKDYTGRPTELIFDHVEKVSSKLTKAQEYADTDKHHNATQIFDSLVVTGLPQKLTFRDIPALQAADLWAWEYRRNHVNLDEWWQLADRPQEWGDEQWKHMEEWVANKFGSFEDATRRSLQELIKRTKFVGMIWSYQELCEAHEARGGVWP